MKTAVSVPEEVFRGAEKLARRLRKSRSELYSDALRAYVAQHDTDEIEARLQHALDAIDEPLDPAVDAAARATLQNVEW